MGPWDIVNVNILQDHQHHKVYNDMLLSTANTELNFYANKKALAGRKSKMDQRPSFRIDTAFWSEFALVISKKEVNDLI